MYFEERWIEKSTRRRVGGSSPRKPKDRRGSRSFSEEELRLRKSSKRRDRERRARSESARYEAYPDLERSHRKLNRKKLGNAKRHEYGESSSESNGDSDEELGYKEKKRKYSRSRKADDEKKTGSSDISEEGKESEENDRSLSDDSLEVVVVKKSLEKTSEKVQISGRKSKTPRETSLETRVMETRHQRSRKKSKTAKSRNNEAEEKEVDRAKGRRKSRKTADIDETKQKSEEKLNLTKEDKKKEQENKFRKDATDSTSQETVERVTVTAFVHKDQAPDTPKVSTEHRKSSVIVPGSKLESKEFPDSKDIDEIRDVRVKSEMDEILEKADELQNALTKAADLKKDVEEIRKQMTSASSKEEQSSPSQEDTKTSTGSSEEVTADSEEPAKVKGRKSSKIVSEYPSEDSQQEFSQMQSQRAEKTSPVEEEKEEMAEKTGEDEKAKKSPIKSSKNESEEEITGKEDATVETFENVQSRPSTARRRSSQASQESISSPLNRKVSVDKSVDQSQKSRIDGEKSEESSEKTSKAESEEEKSQGSQSSREKSSAQLPDDKHTPESTNEEEAHEGSEKLEKSQEPEAETSETGNTEQEDQSKPDSGKLRFVDGRSSGSAKSSRVESRSTGATGRNGRGDRHKSTLKSPSKRSLFESSEDRSPDRSAIVAVFESPEWVEDDEEIEREIRDVVGDDGEEGETEPEDENSVGVLRVLPSTSEEETPSITNKILRTTETLPRVIDSLR